MDYHVKYRPKKLAEVVGQNSVIQSLEQALAKGLNHAYLFMGPSGTGKTTLARILANELGCSSNDIIEVDAATYTSVQNVRELTKQLMYKSFNGDKRVVILDEAHRLSSQAWEALLKNIEEPSPDLYWFFCTTEAGKVPKTIKTRCVQYSLDPVRIKDLETLLKGVSESESLGIEDEVLEIIAAESGGSPRQALTNLALVNTEMDAASVRRLLKSAGSDDAVIELCRTIASGRASWANVLKILNKIKSSGVEAESVRIIITNYLTSVALNSKDAGKAGGIIEYMTYFSTPYPASDKYGPLVLSVWYATQSS